MTRIRIFGVLLFLALSLTASPLWANDETVKEEYLKAREEYQKAKSVMDEEYNKARSLLMEEKFSEAAKAFDMLSEMNPTDLRIRVGLIDTKIEHARYLKANDIPSWKGKVYTAFWDLKELYKEHMTSPEVYLSLAKCYWLNNRPRKAKRSLEKAFYYNSDYADALIFKGDMLFEKSKEKINPIDPDEADEIYKARRVAESAYESVLADSNINAETEAMVRYKLGALYKFHGNMEKANEQWTKAVSIAADSHWGEKAKEGLLELN